ncbi:MAG: hypothetical protein WA982_05505 [Rubrobacteraceae bacterium]
MSERPITGGKRMLCVGRGGSCFACGGRGSLHPVGRRVGMTLLASRCPVCSGQGRARIVGLGDGK